MRRTALAVGLLSLLLAVPALADPSPSPSPTQEPEDPLKISVTELLPRAPQAGQAFEVVGAVRNIGLSAVTGVSVRLARGDVIGTRGLLHELERDGADYTKHFTMRTLYRDSGHTQPIAALAPGGVGYFDIRTDVDSLGLTGTGVYPVDIEALGSIAGSGTQLLGAAPTWVPFFAADARPLQNKVAVVWPVTDQPHQAPDGSFVDDTLASSFAQGPLARLLLAASYAGKPVCDRGAVRNDGVRDPTTTRCQPVPVTYAPDPDLVSAAYAMANTDHYTYGTGHNRKPGTGKVAAAEWLSRLKRQTAADNGSVLAVPYADPDVDALAGSGAGRDDIDQATLLGNQVLADQLPGARVDAAFPPTQGSGILTQAAADALTPRTGRRFAFILDVSAFPDLEDSGRSHSPSAPVTLGPTTDPMHVLVAEDTLSTLVLGGTSADEGSRLAEQRFIAETAIIAAELTGRSRTFLIVPDRNSDADVRATADALRDLGRLPWLCPVALEPVTQGAESCPAPTSAAESQQYLDKNDPRTALRQGNDAQLPAAYLDQVAFQGRRATQLTSAVLDDSSTQSPTTRNRIADLRRRLRQAVARSESSAWRQDPAGQQGQLDLLNGRLTGLVSQISVLSGRLLLTSSKGTIQVAVQNQSDLPVQLKLRFTFPGRPPIETGLISVAPKRSVPAGVKADGLRSGKFPVIVQMLDRADKPFRGTVTVQVNSTRYGRFALGLTFAAAAVLFLAAGARIVRRALRRPAPDSGPGDPA
ncbi:MAG: hypothetical protein JWL79_58 [Frankiales bacterium]|nr:hypothetical protein [Frankiales bacterium]